MKKFNISVDVIIFGYHVDFCFYPMSWKKRLLLCVGEKNGLNRNLWHFMAGPIHIWSMGPHNRQKLRIGIDWGLDPYWGDAISCPSGYKMWKIL